MWFTRNKPEEKKEDPPALGRFPLTLPEAEAAFVRDTYSKVDTILEYGSGGSTKLAAGLGKNCISVESDKEWAETLNSTLAADFGESSGVKVLHVDLGPTGNWGYPTDMSNWARFWRYPLAVWQDDPKPDPDIVLIDGRMRKACFAATMMNIHRNTRVLVDDYADRPHYHDIESFVKPTEMAGRLAVFDLAPAALDAADFQRILPWFFEIR